jgi:hypothetical protein
MKSETGGSGPPGVKSVGSHQASPAPRRQLARASSFRRDAGFDAVGLACHRRPLTSHESDRVSVVCGDIRRPFPDGASTSSPSGPDEHLPDRCRALKARSSVLRLRWLFLDPGPAMLPRATAAWSDSVVRPSAAPVRILSAGHREAVGESQIHGPVHRPVLRAFSRTSRRPDCESSHGSHGAAGCGCPPQAPEPALFLHEVPSREPDERCRPVLVVTCSRLPAYGGSIRMRSW